MRSKKIVGVIIISLVLIISFLIVERNRHFRAEKINELHAKLTSDDFVRVRSNALVELKTLDATSTEILTTLLISDLNNAGFRYAKKALMAIGTPRALAALGSTQSSEQSVGIVEAQARQFELVVSSNLSDSEVFASLPESARKWIEASREITRTYDNDEIKEKCEPDRSWNVPNGKTVLVVSLVCADFQIGEGYPLIGLFDLSNRLLHTIDFKTLDINDFWNVANGPRLDSVEVDSRGLILNTVTDIYEPEEDADPVIKHGLLWDGNELTNAY